MSEIAICNQALSKLGAGRITSLILPSGSDPSVARRVGVCSDLYAPTRDALVGGYRWMFATKEARLVREQSAPEFGYKVQFILPPDCLAVWWAGSAPEREFPRWERVGDRVYADGSDAAYIWYSRRVTDTQLFSAPFVVTLATRLAAEMCYAVTESNSRANALWDEFEVKLGEARAAEGQQGRVEVTRARELTAVRGGSSPYFTSGDPGG